MKSVAHFPDGTDIHYQLEGRGSPTLVSVHGWSCDRRHWNNQLDFFSRRYRVVACDLADHGVWGLSRTNWTMSGSVTTFSRSSPSRRLPDVVLIGHLMGGDVIVETALHEPARIAGLIWIDVYSSLGRTRSAEDVREFIAPFRQDFVAFTRAFVRLMFLSGSDPDLVDWVVSDMSAAPPEVALGALEHAITNDLAIVAGLRELSKPVIAINPDYSSTDSESLHRHGVQSVVMPNVAHFLMMEEPEGFNRLLGAAIEILIETGSSSGTVQPVWFNLRNRRKAPHAGRNLQMSTASPAQPAG